MIVTVLVGGVVAVFVVTVQTVGLVVLNITGLPLAPGVALTVRFGVVLVAPPTQLHRHRCRRCHQHHAKLNGKCNAGCQR